MFGFNHTSLNKSVKQQQGSTVLDGAFNRKHTDKNVKKYGDKNYAVNEICVSEKLKFSVTDYMYPAISSVVLVNVKRQVSAVKNANLNCVVLPSIEGSSCYLVSIF